MNKYFGDKKFYMHVLSVVIPITIQSGITNFVNMLDNVMVGQLGTDSISGVAIINQLFFVYNLCIFGALAGIGIFTAQFYGKGDHEGVRYTFRMQFFTGIIIALISMAVLYFGGDALTIRFFTADGGEGTVEGALFYAHSYLMVMLIELIPFAMIQIYANVLRNCGQTVIPMVAGLVSVGVNLIGNYILIYGKFGIPKLGVVGAALATVLSRCVELFIIAFWTHTHKAENPFIVGAYRHLTKIPSSLIKTVLPKAWPLLVNESTWSIGMTVLVQCYSIRGLSAVTALNIANTIAEVFNIAFISMGSAIAIILGQLLGAGKIEKARADATRLTVFSVLICVGTGALLFLSSDFFPLVYNTTDDIRHLASQLIKVAGFMSPLYAFTNAMYFTIRSGGKTFVTFLFDSCFVWVVNVPIAFFLSRYTALPMLMIYICVNSAEILKCISGYLIKRSGSWAVNLTEQANG